MSKIEKMHFGRSWVNHPIEDACPCNQAPCGLIEDALPDCPQHGFTAAKTMRQFHGAEECPGSDTP